MNGIKIFNSVADIVAAPETLERVILRMLLFLVFAVIAVGLGIWSGVPITIGWMFGWMWGALTVYGTMRRNDRNDT